MDKSKSFSHKRRVIVIGILFILVIISFLLSLAIGAQRYTITEILSTLFSSEDSKIRLIVYNVRLPRIILACLVGMSLSLSGSILQSVMRNNLASPSTIGVTAGASFAGYVMLVAFPQFAKFLPIGTFIGATLTTLFIYALAYKEGVSPVKMILSGLAVSALLGAFNDVIKVFFSDNLGAVSGFLVGGLNGVTWDSVKLVLPYILLGVFISAFLPTKMNILALGDEVAYSLGISTEKLRMLLIIISSVLAGAAISVAGVINFVGLIVPHISRLLVGSDYRYLLPTSVLMGSLMVMVCDTIGRVVILPGEMPVGIIIAFIGAPFFLFLLRKEK